MSLPADPAPRVRGPGFPVLLALTWALLLTAVLVWSLHPEWWSTARDPAAFYRDPASAAPTRTFEMLARVGMFFIVLVWPLLLLKRGVWRPRGKAAPRLSTEPRRFGSPQWIAESLVSETEEPLPEPQIEEPVDESDVVDDEPPPPPPRAPAPLAAEGAAASGELLTSGATTFTPIDSVVPPAAKPAGGAVDTEPSGRFDVDAVLARVSGKIPAPAPAPQAPPPPPVPVRAPAPSPVPSNALVTAPPPRPTPRPTVAARRPSPVPRASEAPLPRLDEVGLGRAILQLLVIVLIAAPFWVAASYLSDVERARVLETAMVIAAFGLLHVGYAAATRGRSRAPDRFYLLGLLLLTVGWAWANRWTEQFALPGLPLTDSVENFCPLLLVDRIALAGLPASPADGDTTLTAAFWPAGAGLLLFLAGFLTAKE